MQMKLRREAVQLRIVGIANVVPVHNALLFSTSTAYTWGFPELFGHLAAPYASLAMLLKRKPFPYYRKFLKI
jgi:hypothetical protein